MPFGIGPGELIIVLIIALIVVGPGKLPDVGAALGKSIREFRKASTDVKEAVSLEEPAPAPASAPAPAPASAPAAVPATAAAAVPVVTAVPVAAPLPPAPPAVAAPVPAVPVAAPVAAAPGTATAEPAGGWPAELTPSDEQPTPSA
jgi:TatA/E family protein of Tat protein translocase